MKRFLRLGVVLCLFAICMGCGQTFRPIIIPNPPKYPNPQASHTAVTLSDNGTIVRRQRHGDRRLGRQLWLVSRIWD